MDKSGPAGVSSIADMSLAAEELAAQRTALWGRVLALLMIAVLITIVTPWPGPLFYYPLLVVFVLLGFGALLAERARIPWLRYVFVTADFALLTFTLLYPNPLIPYDFPPQFTLRFGSFIYFFVLLAGLAYVYRPMLVLWGGVSAALSWTIGIAWLVNLPGAVVQAPTGQNREELMEAISSPYFVDLGVRLQEAIVLLITAGLLALAVSRARAIALRQASLASEKTNLSRYFPRKTVELLATKTNPLSEPREHMAAVLFADLVSFTGWAENRPARETIGVLREVHALLAETVFRHDGTLDKFIGDGLMATFGTPEASDRDAVNALAAAVEMADVFRNWKQSRAGSDAGQLELAIGVHYGPIVLGDIGSDRRMEFAVLGDTVNVASRLEQANREIGCRLIVSVALVEAAMAENPDDTKAALARLKKHGPLSLRGRSATTDVLMLQ
ncbi:adenylate/guanylate cyclase domain-containing protein [Hoeflea poritis]|uniref:Adenylate/guanylate cyclase domain-containing protein n=1 Tax=Hoeflea poritis TaxID=2993659 RepID=A0ABT4VNW6_9HYPH|nr:adenylate/guanylate cyclase domain-containing protein [Hoeflea poritis]MDA4846387.1 adenylate/guanylate cyclase domain-containing protein [Hoeflea poritis]